MGVGGNVGVEGTNVGVGVGVAVGCGVGVGVGEGVAVGVGSGVGIGVGGADVGTEAITLRGVGVGKGVGVGIGVEVGKAVGKGGWVGATTVGVGGGVVHATIKIRTKQLKRRNKAGIPFAARMGLLARSASVSDANQRGRIARPCSTSEW